MIYIVVALPAEAKPLVAHYRLKARTPAGPFPVYLGDDAALVVSGVGKANAAAACAHLHAVSGSPADAPWLNLGIGGHGNRLLGELVVAHRIRDAGSGRSWYPPPVLKLAGASDTVLTVDTPQAGYPEEGVVDMEAAGFYATACRFSTSELVQCAKVISDNRHSGPERVTGKGVARLIGAQVVPVDALAVQLRALAAEIQAFHTEPAELERFLTRWRFTVCEQSQLLDVLRRWTVLAGGASIWCGQLERCARGKDALRLVQEHVERLPLRLA